METAMPVFRGYTTPKTTQVMGSLGSGAWPRLWSTSTSSLARNRGVKIHLSSRQLSSASSRNLCTPPTCCYSALNLSMTLRLKHFVKRSAGFSSVRTQTIFKCFSATLSCSRKYRVSMCRCFPSPRRFANDRALELWQ